MSERYPFTEIKEAIAIRKGKALDFAVGHQPFPLSETIFEWIHENFELALSPCSPCEVAEFNTKAAAYLSRVYDINIEAQNILPVAGGRAGMSLVAACTLSESDTVVVTEPGYPAFARIASQRGVSLVTSELDPKRKFSPDFSCSDSIAYDSVKMLAVNYPNNPSGATLSSQVCDAMAQFIHSGAIIFNDATYGALVYGDRSRSILELSNSPEDYPEVVELHSISKLFPIGSMAVSFLAGTPKLMRKLSTYSDYAGSPLSRLQLAATARCLHDSERIELYLQHIPGQIASLQDLLRDIGFSTFPAESGMYVVSQVPERIGSTPISSPHHAARVLMDQFDIAVVPLETRTRGYLRFSALYRPGDLEKLAELKQHLEIE